MVKKNAVVIVAAGRGERLGKEGGPKQYRLLSDKTILQHTIDCFAEHQSIHAIQVVIHADDRDLYSNSTTPNSKLHEPVVGGATRQASCKAGVDALVDNEYDKVLIHDAARPFVSGSVISNVLNGTHSGMCALPAIAIADTVKRKGNNGQVLETIPRTDLSLAQTPQGFLLDEIKQAHTAAVEQTSEDFTDDAAIAEWAGMNVVLVEGDRGNFKVTTQQDLEAAIERIAMQSMTCDIRTGSGYDVHILGPGSGVILCGVEIPHNRSLQGHSDADVGLHALTDALLGTIGDGDIGSHFPPSDPKWKGESSDMFLEHAKNLVSEQGGKITNLDVTIICEAPKIGPHRLSMRQRVAEICGLEIQRVSVKATTNEKVGFIGRQEGIAALATATVSFGMI
ncbi:MAG: bifunctional 2-C-methyl-D-erythritol 4-phosphate cytidylyltransferase/2-C-methyl-D-erythritol 2,4-cyclodiphosphate synthase [Pseudomonadota bacterium]